MRVCSDGHVLNGRNAMVISEVWVVKQPVGQARNTEESVVVEINKLEDHCTDYSNAPIAVTN